MSTGNKHTPGEWIVKHSESKPAFNVVNTKLGGKYKIARCPYVETEHTELDEREKAEAYRNATLVAAALELLESLKWCAAVLQVACDINKPIRESQNIRSQGISRKIKDVLDAADAALAKAQPTSILLATPADGVVVVEGKTV